jgi:hypothetical protein
MKGYSKDDSDDPISPSQKVKYGFGLLALAMVASFPSPSGILYVPVFPFGLGCIFSLLQLPERLSMAMGYAAYVFAAVAFVSAKTKREFGVALRIYEVMLILNVAGCHIMLRDFSSIH